MSNHHDSAQPDPSQSSSSTSDSSMNGCSSSNTSETYQPFSEAGPSRLRSGSTTDPVRPTSPETVFPARPSTPHLDLATYPTSNLLKLLAQLLQHIAESNDTLRPELDDLEEDATDHSASQTDSESRSSHPPHPSPTSALFHSDYQPQPTPSSTTFDDPIPLFTASKTSLGHSSSLLAFHARHVPSISIEAYLLRILKYCPTTNEVFLGLLVYFDRMSRLGTPAGVGGEAAGARRGVGRGFAIDSYNVHRLVIAGVTVASKFFSDVFYTNSRYAKVGGLPSHELNQLELQFLLLNDFRLVILPEEMQRYGDRLLGYYEDQEEKRTTEAKRTDSEAVQTTQIEVDSSAKSQTNGSALEQPADNSQPPRVSQPTHNSSAPPSAPSSTIEPQAAPSRHRESKSGSVSFAEPPRPHHPPSHGGLRSWVSGTVGGEVMSGRVASPMCD